VADDQNVEPADQQPTDQQAGTTLQLRDQGAETHYANTCVLTSTAEEVVMNYALNIQPLQRDGTVTMQINSRIVMTYPSAKRLALTLSQVIQRYESANGVIRLDRTAGGQPPAATGAPAESAT
jgi:hypothetical protein